MPKTIWKEREICELLAYRTYGVDGLKEILNKNKIISYTINVFKSEGQESYIEIIVDTKDSV